MATEPERFIAEGIAERARMTPRQVLETPRLIDHGEADEIPAPPRARQTLFPPDSDSSYESYVDAKDGAAFLRIHSKTLMQLAREGIIPAYSISEGRRRHWRFLISELDKWMKTKVNSSAHPVRSRPADERRK